MQCNNFKIRHNIHHIKRRIQRIWLNTECLPHVNRYLLKSRGRQFTSGIRPAKQYYPVRSPVTNYCDYMRPMVGKTKAFIYTQVKICLLIEGSHSPNGDMSGCLMKYITDVMDSN